MMAPALIADSTPLPSGHNSPKAEPTKLYSVNEPPFEGFKPIDTKGWAQSNPNTAIVIDNGICALHSLDIS
jgi:actin-related protein 5